MGRWRGGLIDHLHCEDTIFKMALHSVNGEVAAIKHTVNWERPRRFDVKSAPRKRFAVYPTAVFCASHRRKQVLFTFNFCSLLTSVSKTLFFLTFSSSPRQIKCHENVLYRDFYTQQQETKSFEGGKEKKKIGFWNPLCGELTAQVAGQIHTNAL